MKWDMPRTWTDYIKHVKIMLCDKTVEVGVDEGKTGACTPVAKEPGFDIVKSNLAFIKNVILKENHGYMRIIEINMGKWQ